MNLHSFIIKPPILTAAFLFLAFLAIPAKTVEQAQDQTYRLMNVERRLDQMQIRVDYLERNLQTASLNNTSSNITSSAILELQRQQLSLAEQIVTMQRQMLEMKKEIDRLSERSSPERKEEKKDKPEEKPKPKTAPGRP